MAELTVFTYNLRVDAPEDGINSFENRRDFIRSRFPAYGADLAGFQEVLPHMRQWLTEAFPEYQICGLGREKDLTGESNPIAFRRDRFDLAALNTFWLSDTPSEPGSRFHTDQSDCPRICTYAVLRHKESGKLFRLYNTHLDHLGPTAQAQGLSLVLSQMAEDFLRGPMPVILMGDFNAFPDSLVYRTAASFSGCGRPLTDAAADVGFTYHGYRPETVQEKIDYIFTTLPCDPGRSFRAEDTEHGVYLSDHYPVGAYLEL